MPNVNKVEYNGQTLIDLTSDTVTPDTLLTGVTAHGADGSLLLGTYDPEANYHEEKVIQPINGYFTARNGFKAERSGNVVLFTSYINIQKTIPEATSFASIGFDVNTGSVGFLLISTKQCYPVYVNSNDNVFKSETEIPTGYYIVIGCATLKNRVV